MCCFSGSLIHNLLLVRSKVNEYVKTNTASHIALHYILLSSLSAGISTKRQDILKLIGTSYAPNGKFAWIELNGEDYGWTREGRNVGKYRIVMVEMGKVKLELFGRIVELKLLPDDAQWAN